MTKEEFKNLKVGDLITSIPKTSDYFEGIRKVSYKQNEEATYHYCEIEGDDWYVPYFAEEIELANSSDEFEGEKYE